MKGWCVYTSMKQCLQLVNHEQFPVQMTQDNKHNKWYEILDFQPKLLQRTPTKIHRERRRRRQQQETTRKAQRTSPGAQLLTSPSTAKATSLTQWPQTCAEAATKYYCDYNPEYLEPKAPSTHPPHPHTHPQCLHQEPEPIGLSVCFLLIHMKHPETLKYLFGNLRSTLRYKLRVYETSSLSLLQEMDCFL